MAVLSIDDIVKIIVNLSPRSAVRSGFNLSLIVGASMTIPIEDRVMVFNSADSMLDAGFSKNSPEYQAALTYFAQSSKPGKLAVGRWEPGTESLLDAITACRQANREWYICLPLSFAIDAGDGNEPKQSITSDDILDAARYIEGARPSTVLFYTTQDMELLKTMKGLNYRRSLGMYSETENAAVAIAGWAMGANTSLRNSAYTLAYKTLVGIPVDPLDEHTVEALKKVNGNYYVNRGMQYDGFEPGTMADGVWFDEMINLDMLENDVQLCVMDLLHNVKSKIPQTEGGVLSIIAAFTPALEKAVRTGFIAPGIWRGPGIMGLETGDAIPLGYLIQSESIDEQSQADRDARMAPPIYVAVKLAGAIQYAVIQIDVNR